MPAGIDAGSHGKVSTDIPYADPIHHLRSVGNLRRSHGFGRPAQIRRQGAELEPARPILPVEHPALRPDRAALRAAARYDSRVAVVIARSDLCLLFLVCRIYGRMDAAARFGVVPLELRALPVQPARADPLGFLPALVRVRDAAGISARPAGDPDSTHRRGVRRLKPERLLKITQIGGAFGVRRGLILLANWSGTGSGSDLVGTVQGAVATWRLVRNDFRGRQVATAPCTVPFSEFASGIRFVAFILQIYLARNFFTFVKSLFGSSTYFSFQAFSMDCFCFSVMCHESGAS